jgi:hypothetical protein
VPSPAAFASAGDAALEQRAGLVLVHACQQELAALGSSLEEDLALLRGGGEGFGGKGPKGQQGGSGGGGAAVAFRVEKKRVLAECLRRLTGGGQ